MLEKTPILRSVGNIPYAFYLFSKFNNTFIHQENVICSGKEVIRSETRKLSPPKALQQRILHKAPERARAKPDVGATSREGKAHWEKAKLTKNMIQKNKYKITRIK